MLIANNKTIALIGFAGSTVTQEANHFIGKEFSGKITIINPDDFLNLTNKQDYQYFVAFTLDIVQRAQVIDIIESMNLDCIKYAHETVVCYQNIDQVLGRGSFVAPYTTILLSAQIGNHCIIETNCLVAHYSTLADNVVLHAGTLIAGRTTIGANTVFNFKSSTINAVSICGNIEVGATSTVTKDIDQSGYYLGTPARRVGNRLTFKDTK